MIPERRVQQGGIAPSGEKFLLKILSFRLNIWSNEHKIDPAMRPLTEKQKKVLTFIENRLVDNNPPSQREIAEHFGLAQNAVYQLVGYLKEKGYLVDTGGHRGLRLSQPYFEQVRQADGVPVIGQVPAGEPLLAEQNIEGYIKPDELFKPSKDAFILKVRGDSMVDEGIMDGDYVVVQPVSAVENGRIAVVLLDDEATVKKVYVRKDHIALEPANSKAGYKTRYVKRGSQKIRIIGKVVSCFRLL
jgi:repressor LexA